MRTAITAFSMAAIVLLAMNQGPASAQGAADIAKDISADVLNSDAYSLIAAMPERQLGIKAPLTGSVALLNSDTLSDISAGESDQTLALTNQSLTATSTGNMINASSVNAGDVTFGANVFSGFNGIGNFVINTGNNNVLQGSLSVTVQQ